MRQRPDRVADDPRWRFAAITVGSLFRLSHRLRIEGVDRIPAHGPAILAANHVSPLDPIAIALGALRRGRTIRYLAAAEAFRIPVIGWGLRFFEQIPVHRGQADRAAIAEAAGVIANGALAGIFPEGGLGDGDELRPFRSGTARLAIAAGAPVIPIGVWGMQQRWPRGGLKFRPPLRPIAAVAIGEPISVAWRGDDEQAVRALTDETARSVEHLVARARAMTGGVPSWPT